MEVATCTHLRTCVPDKQKRKTINRRKEISDTWKKNNRFKSCNSAYFFSKQKNVFFFHTGMSTSRDRNESYGHPVKASTQSVCTGDTCVRG